MPSVRHLRSFLYALVLAPAVWVLCGAGFARDLTGRSASAGVLLVLAGAAYAVLLLTPISPAGPLIAGLVFLALGMWGMVAPDSYASIWPSGAVRDDFDLSRPGYALGVLLAVPLVCTALSARRWAGRERPRPPMIGTPGRDARGAAAAPGTPVAAESTAVLTAPASAFAPPTRPVVPTVPGSTHSPTAPDSSDSLTAMEWPDSLDEPPTEVVPTEAVPVAASDEPTLVTGPGAGQEPTVDTTAAAEEPTVVTAQDEPTVVVAAGDEPPVATAGDEPTAVVTAGDEPTVVTAGDAADEPTVFVVNAAGETTAPARTEDAEDDEPTVVTPSDENTEVIPTGAEKADAEEAGAETADAEEADAEEADAETADAETAIAEAADAEAADAAAADAETADAEMADAETAETVASEDAEVTEEEGEPTVEADVPAAEPEEPAAEAEEPADQRDEPDELAAAAAEQPAAEEEVEAEPTPDEPQDDPGERTQVIPLRPAAVSAEKTHDLRDMVRRPGTAPGEETQVIFWRPPSEADVRRAAEAQAARDREAQERSRQAFRDLAAQERARQAFAERAAQEALERGDETQVIKLPGADEPAADRTQVLSVAQPPAGDPQPSIVGEERPDPGIDPTTRLVKPSDDTADMADQRVGSVLDLERPADEIADDPTRRLRIPQQRSDDGDRRGATPR